jgi:hypothetical protein
MTYTPDYRGIAGYLNYDSDLRDCLRLRTFIGVATARAVAPKGSAGDTHAGRFAANISGQDNGPFSGGITRDRMSFSVLFTDPAAKSILFGTKDTPAHTSVIDATLRAMGDPHHNPRA